MDTRFQGTGGGPSIQPELVRRIIVNGEAELLVNQAQSFGEAMQAAGLTKSQIRGVFGTVRQIDAAWEKTEPKDRLRKVLLLKPRLAYQGAREPKVRPLAGVLAEAIDRVAEAKEPTEQTRLFGYFVDLFEAILAYHTAAGGR